MLSIIASWAAILGLFVTQSYPPPWPRDGATKILENERVVIWDVTYEKGKPTAMHEHKLNLVGVFLAGGVVKHTFPDDTFRLSPSVKVGQAIFQKSGVVHTEEGVSETDCRGIIVELKKYPPPALETKPGVTPAFPRESAIKLLENERVIVWDYTWVLGNNPPPHMHDKDTVLVYIQPGKFLSDPHSDTAGGVFRSFGEVVYNNRNKIHASEAEESSPRAIVIELK